MKKYDFQKIESKWRKKWLDEKVFRAREDSKKPKYYQLETFPYVSAEGLHVGHPKGYIAEDIHARYMRMCGYEVLYTMGWDVFGLPTENYAIKVRKNPKDVAAANIKNFKRQVQMFGLSYDWAREIDTASPEYYKWTQWLFIQLFKRGLAYRAKAKVSWCPKDQTVLANEQVINGRCERDDELVEQREMEQWFFKITDYAERLLDDLGGLDPANPASAGHGAGWPEATIKRQRDWIGKSEGAEIEFPLNHSLSSGEVVFASNNLGKLNRMRKLFKAAGLHKIVLKTPKEAGVEDFDVVEDGATLHENAEKKARVLAGKTNLPIFADDSGFFIDGAEVDPVAVKRNALSGADEKSLDVEEIARRMQKYYRDIASSRGGRVDAEWRNALCLVTPDGVATHIESVRPVILTDESHGTIDPHLPLRGLYISKTTGKYVLEQTEKEEMEELRPITDGIKKLFTPVIKVFTTRPDTLFGATYLVLSPEHEQIQNYKSQIPNWKEVGNYIKQAKHKTELQRQEDARSKTGVELKGVKVINPATKEEISVWVADYVLGSYGAGAIMAVPAHDERDFEFAKKFNLPVREVVLQKFGQKKDSAVFRDSVAAVITRFSDSKILTLFNKQSGEYEIPGGGRDGNEDDKTTLNREIMEETGYVDFKIKEYLGQIETNFFEVGRNEERTKHQKGYHVILLSEKNVPLKPDIHEDFELRWIELEDAIGKLDSNIHRCYESQFIRRFSGQASICFAGDGELINSDKFDGMDSEKAKWEITKFVGGTKKVQYKLRDWSVSRQRYWGVPIPLVFCENCKKQAEISKSEFLISKQQSNDSNEGELENLGWIAVPEEDLPVLLPDLKNYRPKGKPPLAGSKKFINVKCPQCKGNAERSAETLDTFVDSSWYYLRYADSKNDKKPFDKKKAAHWLPVDLYVIGAEHTVLHLLYSRFITKFLYDAGYLDFTEPFLKLRHQGLIQGADGRKMSKRWGNVINPDDLIREFGADTVRLYEMFMGPFEDGQPWDPKGVLGTHRYLNRFFEYARTAIDSPELEKKETSSECRRTIHRAVKKVGEDIIGFKFNTAVSALMILLNELDGKTASKGDLEILVKLLHPFAPHLAQEFWSELGHKTYLDYEPWPKHDPELIKEDDFDLVVQVNGKHRDTVRASVDIDEEEAKRLALKGARVKELIGSKPIRKIIYVKNRLINFVL